MERIGRMERDFAEYDADYAYFCGDIRYDRLGLRQPKNSKWSHPYSYDPIIVYFGNLQDSDSAVYSDRLAQWDGEKYTKCLNSVRNKQPHQRFSNDDPKQVSEFLSLYFDKQVEVTVIVEGCNASNGYPYWVFYYRSEQQK